MEGYIKLFRSLADWEWYGDSNTTRVFLDILIHTNYKPSKYKGYDIKAGECVIGRKAIADRLNISERQVRTAINHLKSTNELTIKTTNKFSIVTVENWDKWQVIDGDTDQQNDQQRVKQKSNKSQTKVSQMTTSKEIKKERNKERKNYYIPNKEAESEYNEWLKEQGRI